jgi:hypothetical protein
VAFGVVANERTIATKAINRPIHAFGTSIAAICSNVIVCPATARPRLVRR